MPGIVADTPTIVWYLSRDSRLSLAGHPALTAATTGGDLIHIPSICLVELTCLAAKGRLPSAAREALVQALDDPSGSRTLAPLDRLVAGRCTKQAFVNLFQYTVTATDIADSGPTAPFRPTAETTSHRVRNPTHANISEWSLSGTSA